MKIFSLFSCKSLYILLFIFLTSIQCQQSSQQPPQRRGKIVRGRNNYPVQPDGQMSRSQRIKLQQKEKYHQTQSKVPPQTEFKQFLFAIKGVEQFHLNLPSSQQIAANIIVYTMVDSSYMRPLKIEQSQPPVKLSVYQNNNRLIHQSQFYYQAYVVFSGEQLSTYTIRFINLGVQEKLIVMNLNKVIEHNHIQQIVDKKQIEKHAQKAGRVNEQLKFVFNAFGRYSMINLENIKRVLENIRLYTYWQSIEMLIATIVCFVQVTLIRRICRSQSIV